MNFNNNIIFDSFMFIQIERIIYFTRFWGLALVNAEKEKIIKYTRSLIILTTFFYQIIFWQWYLRMSSWGKWYFFFSCKTLFNTTEFIQPRQTTWKLIAWLITNKFIKSVFQNWWVERKGLWYVLIGKM